jgi:hypothetical protein
MQHRGVAASNSQGASLKIVFAFRTPSPSAVSSTVQSLTVPCKAYFVEVGIDTDKSVDWTTPISNIRHSIKRSEILYFFEYLDFSKGLSDLTTK